MKGQKSTKPCAFIYCKQRRPTNQERVFEPHDRHNAKWTFTRQDHQLTKISYQETIG